jgi:cytochrome c-type biogenesis protein
VILAADLASAFGVGLAATLSPCALPLYPGFLAYLAAKGDRTGSAAVVRWLGLFVLLGVLTMMIALGVVLAIASGAIAGGGAVLRIVVTITAEIVVVALGALLVLGINPFARLPSLGANVQARGAILSAYVYGLLYGPIALPCSAALLISIFTLSVTVGTFAERMLFFLAFGLGFGVPLFVLSLLAPAQQSWLLRQFTRHYSVATRLAGVVLIVVGASDLVANLATIRLYF